MAIKEGATSVSEIEQAEEKLKAVDINSSGLYEGEEAQIDAKEDWQARSAPPPKGKYRLQFFPSNNEKVTDFVPNPRQLADGSKVYFYTKDVMCKIVSEDEKVAGSIVGVKFSTGIQKGKTKSSMYGVLELGGNKLPLKIKDLSLARGFAKWLAKEPIMVAECDWRAWDTTKDKDNPFGKVLLEGMINFPVVDGKRSHVVRNAKGQEFTAKLRVVKWIGKNVANGIASVASTQQTQQANPNKPPVQQSKPTAPVPVVEDEIIMEAETGGFEGVIIDGDGEVMLMD